MATLLVNPSPSIYGMRYGGFQRKTGRKGTSNGGIGRRNKKAQLLPGFFHVKLVLRATACHLVVSSRHTWSERVNLQCFLLLFPASSDIIVTIASTLPEGTEGVALRLVIRLAYPRWTWLAASGVTRAGNKVQAVPYTSQATFTQYLWHQSLLLFLCEIWPCVTIDTASKIYHSFKLLSPTIGWRPYNHHLFPSIRKKNTHTQERRYITIMREEVQKDQGCRHRGCSEVYIIIQQGREERQHPGKGKFATEVRSVCI